MSGPYAGHTVLVAGAGISGAAAAEVLQRLGAKVVVTDRNESARTEALSAGGATFAAALTAVPAAVDLVVTSPGWRPDHPLLSSAARAGVEVIGEVELAWRVRGAFGRPPAPWLAVTGTNGKTTTVEMLAAMLRAGGLRALAAGNIGRPLVQAVADSEPHEALAVELSSFQLHWSSSLAPAAAAILNVAPDHLDWHGSMENYAADKARVLAPGTLAVYNVDDTWSVRLTAAADRRVGFTLAEPADGQLGLVGSELVDRALGHGPFADAGDLALGQHNIANALAAAALAFSQQVSADAVRSALGAFRPGRHRNEVVGTLDGVMYVNDSKATNAHAAAASVSSYDRIVWIAGGLLKGATVDDLVVAAAPRLAGVVLLGVDRAEIAAALARHAPNVPVVEVARTDDGAMIDVLSHARRMAGRGDVVLLAPAAASMDMFTDYAARGEAFVRAARALGVA
ncbi:MAG: UDP-N-acetylmuramoyl-L-alanine--D-glutamate ligase [Mycobacteriales bacterium]